VFNDELQKFVATEVSQVSQTVTLYIILTFDGTQRSAFHKD